MNNTKIFFSFILLISCFMLLFCPQELLAKSKKVTGDKKEAEVKKEPINEADFQPVLIGVLLDNLQSGEVEGKP